MRSTFVGKRSGKIKTVERAGIRAVVSGRSPDQRLGQEEEGHDDEVLDGRLLAFRRGTGEHLRMDMFALSFPAEVVELAEGEENERRARKEGDEAEGAPEKGIPARGVPRHGVVGEVIGVRERPAGTIGYGSPGGPGKKCRQLLQLFGVADEIL